MYFIINDMNKLAFVNTHIYIFMSSKKKSK